MLDALLENIAQTMVAVPLGVGLMIQTDVLQTSRVILSYVCASIESVMKTLRVPTGNIVT